MAMPSLLLILLLLSTLLACNARRLPLFQGSNSVSRFELSSLISQGFRTDQLERSLDKNSGHKVSTSSEIGVEILKGMKKHKRLAMEIPIRDKQKLMNSEENAVGEDMVVMDYAQPHRKPPIHNEKP